MTPFWKEERQGYSIFEMNKTCIFWMDFLYPGFYFSNGTGGEWFLSKGYYISTGGEFSKCEISQNLVYVGSHLVLVKKIFGNSPNLFNLKKFMIRPKTRFVIWRGTQLSSAIDHHVGQQRKRSESKLSSKCSTFDMLM